MLEEKVLNVVSAYASQEIWTSMDMSVGRGDDMNEYMEEIVLEKGTRLEKEFWILHYLMI